MQVANKVCRQCGTPCRKSVVKAKKRKTNPKRFVFLGNGADNRTCSERSERNSETDEFIRYREASAACRGTRSVQTMHCIVTSPVANQRYEKTNRNYSVRFCLLWCGQQDLNLHEQMLTRTWILRVCQFRHVRITLIFYLIEPPMSNQYGKSFRCKE